jgi:hypothetical protein
MKFRTPNCIPYQNTGAVPKKGYTSAIAEEILASRIIADALAEHCR